MVNYCKLCGADLTPTKELKLMTWEEFVDWAKELNAEIEERYIKICGCFFWKDGTITRDNIISENRSYEQMQIIIENLI